MGKKLIIKDADFSANAVETRNWVDMQLYKPSIWANPSSADFGKEIPASNNAYKPVGRNINSISVPAGKKLVVAIVNNSGTFQSFTGNTVSYGTAISGSIPSGVSVESMYFGDTMFSKIREYQNNTNKTLNVVGSFRVEDVAEMNVSLYSMKYVIEDI